MPDVAFAPSATRDWHVLWTRSNCESMVRDQLAPQGFEVFLPMVESWSRRGGARHLTRMPLFAGYLFLRHDVDKDSYLQICKTRGLVRVVGERWDRLAVIAESEIEAIQRLINSGLDIFPHSYLREGQRVRIRRGPLADVEGIIVRSNSTKGLLVVSVHLLQRSVAVHLDCTMLEAV